MSVEALQQTFTRASTNIYRLFKIQNETTVIEALRLIRLDLSSKQRIKRIQSYLKTGLLASIAGVPPSTTGQSFIQRT